MSNYYDEQGNIRVDLLTRESEKLATDFVKLFNGKPDKNPKNCITSGQLRKFYNEFKGFEKKLIFARNSQPDMELAFRRVLPLVKMVKSKVAYSKNKVPDSFALWLQKNVESINSAKDFEAFLLHFEAVVGFCYGMGLKS